MVSVTQRAHTDAGAAQSSIAVSLTGVAGGSRTGIVVGVKAENSSGGTISVSDGTTTFTPGTLKRFAPTQQFCQFFYLTTANSGNKTYTASFAGGNVDFPSIHVWEVDAGSGNSWAFDAEPSGGGATGTSTAPNSGAMNATGGAGIGFGIYGEFSSGTISAPLINGAAADFSFQFTPGNTASAYWDKTYAAPFNAAASCTLSGSGDWVCNGLAMKAFTPTGPNVTSVDSASPQIGDTLTITGTLFGASQGAGSVTIGGVAQTVTSWANTSIAVTVVRGTNKFGAAVNIIVTDNSLVPSTPFGLDSLLPINGWSFVDLTTPNPVIYNRLTATPDIASGDQISWENVSVGVTVAADATFVAVNSVQRFQFEVWTPADGWGSIATQEIAPPARFTYRNKNNARTHSKLWRREGWINTRVHRAGWYNKDLILPGSAAGSHAATGALASDAATLAGTATHLTLHATSGALSAQAATIAATAAHQHVATGALAAQAATLAATAAHLTLHTTTGALASQSATMAGTAAHSTAATHATTGALAADAATVAGAAAHLTLHASSGALAAQAATVTGAAAHEHAATGALAAAAAAISGAAAHTAAGVHDAAGTLQADAATIGGTANHIAVDPGDLFGNFARVGLGPFVRRIYAARPPLHHLAQIRPVIEPAPTRPQATEAATVSAPASYAVRRARAYGIPRVASLFIPGNALVLTRSDGSVSAPSRAPLALTRSKETPWQKQSQIPPQ